MKVFKKIILVLAILTLIGILIFLGINYAEAEMNKIKKDSNPVVTMEIENYGTIKMELYPDMAPNTVKNFITLANNGYYNGKTISEVGKSTISGGFDLNTEKEESKDKKEKKDDKKKDAETEESEQYITGPKLSDIRTLEKDEKDSAYSIKGEFVEAGYTDNTLSHEKGIVTMARKTYNDYQNQISLMQMMGQDSYLSTIISLLNDTAGSGFSIMTKNDISYDGEYAAFGKVIEGIEIVDKISKVECKKQETDKSEDKKDDDDENAVMTPKKEIKITKMTVDTKGVNYGAPEMTGKVDFESLFSQLMSSMQSGNN